MESLTIKQKAILEVALNLFYNKGYADTSMRDIAEVMNIKAASLYAHIKSKEQIMEWISQDVETRFKNIISKIKEETNPKEQFQLLVKYHIEEIFKNVKLFDVFFTNVFRLKVDFSNQNKYLKSIDNYKIIAEKITQNYILSYTDKPNLDVNLMSEFGIYILNNIYRYIHFDNMDLDRMSEFLKEMFLYGAIGKK